MNLLSPHIILNFNLKLVEIMTATKIVSDLGQCGQCLSKNYFVAVVAQQWVARVTTEPGQMSVSQRFKSPVLIKCEIDFIGGGRNFVEVIGWRWDQYHFATKPHSVAGKSTTTTTTRPSDLFLHHPSKLVWLTASLF